MCWWQVGDIGSRFKTLKNYQHTIAAINIFNPSPSLSQQYNNVTNISELTGYLNDKIRPQWFLAEESLCWRLFNENNLSPTFQTVSDIKVLKHQSPTSLAVSILRPKRLKINSHQRLGRFHGTLLVRRLLSYKYNSNDYKLSELNHGGLGWDVSKRAQTTLNTRPLIRWNSEKYSRIENIPRSL